ncbi:hypothetical protein L484_002446 [Morus notabilis]|uniref:Uncharacterized protein n=1 Tax=Morus notabilis TaxID=981085 RepID=W9S0I2_9ROSA|nr:hypothetical protein L484_002446 [Morus notabilis]
MWAAGPKGPNTRVTKTELEQQLLILLHLSLLAVPPSSSHLSSRVPLLHQPERQNQLFFFFPEAVPPSSSSEGSFTASSAPTSRGRTIEDFIASRRPTFQDEISQNASGSRSGRRDPA